LLSWDVSQIERPVSSRRSKMAVDYIKLQNARALKMLDLYEGANGRRPVSMKELAEWIASPEGEAATAYDIDTQGRIIPDLVE
jgi:hypothetical protein